tara:strand:+ start:761 stop:955 length:195 start_codon:yes stop_codon:yes gene_type:complete
MNPLWALFFKDKYRTIFSIYKMSLAEIIFLLALTAGAGMGIYLLGDKVLSLSDTVETPEVVVEE